MSDLMREQFEKKYKAPAGCRWNSMTEEYSQSWDELSGDDDIEKEIRIHNDRFLAWKASRECLAIKLPEATITGTWHLFGFVRGFRSAQKLMRTLYEIEINKIGVKTK